MRLSTLLFLAGVILGSLAGVDALAWLAWPAAACVLGWGLTTNLVDRDEPDESMVEFERRRAALRCATRGHR